MKGPTHTARTCGVEGCERHARPDRRDCQAHHNRQTSVSRQRRGLGGRQGKGSRRLKRSIYLAVSREEWVALYEKQEGRCAVCFEPLRNRYAEGTTGRMAALDHDGLKETALLKQGAEPLAALRRSVRGLLCTYPCNRLLTRFWYGSSERLYRAYYYITFPPAEGVIQ